MMNYDIKHNIDENRFEVVIEGKLSILDYEIKDGRMLFMSTHVDPDLGGRGIASALTDVALDYAIKNQLKIVPVCSFTKSYLLKNNDKYKSYLNS